MKIMAKNMTNRGGPQSGSVLVLALLLLLVLGGLTATLTTLNLQLGREHVRARDELRAFCAAEGGLNEAHAVLLDGGVDAVRALEYPRAAGSGSYRVELLEGRDDPEIEFDRVRLRSLGEAGGEPAGVQLMLRRVPTGPYEFAAFGSGGLRLNSNVSVDSFDSKDGPYPEKLPYVNDFGNVGSYARVELDSNVSIYGDALVGPEGVFADDAPDILVSGVQEARELSVAMPAVTVPSFPSQGALSASGATSIPPGNHHYSSLTIQSGTLTIRGPSTLVLDAFLMRSGTALVVDATNGPVKVYATGDFVLRSNTTVTTNTLHARDLEVLITSSNLRHGTTIELSSNSRFMGTLYAPDAALRLPSNFTVFGAVKAAFVELASNSRIHYDEDLLYDPNLPDVLERLSWRRLSREELRGLAGTPLP
jgi:hypothetical protein